MNTIFELPVITMDPCVLFWDIDLENSPRVQEYEQQVAAVHHKWREILSQPFDAIEVFVLDNPPVGERKHVHILTHSLRQPDAIQNTVISDWDGVPAFHECRQSLEDVIQSLEQLSAQNTHVYAEILTYPNEKDYEDGRQLLQKFELVRQITPEFDLSSEIIEMLRRLNLLQPTVPYLDGLERVLIYHEASSRHPEGWYAEQIPLVEEGLAYDMESQIFLANEISKAIPNCFLV